MITFYAIVHKDPDSAFGLAFPDLPDAVNASKMAILIASLTAGTLGIVWLRLIGSAESGRA